MSIHAFGSIITGEGVAANNRGENEGNITTLQKLLWKGNVHTTVSSEAIRFALRYYWQMTGKEVNRVWNEDKQDHEWKDPRWTGWKSEKGQTYIDDDVLGYMLAEGGKTEGEKGSAMKRRGVLEIARAISLLPYGGDISFNAKSGEKGHTSIYGAEIHATRYQYGFAITPEALRERSRAMDVIDAIVNLGEVAGNHSRFLFDFSPDSIILRLSHDPAPRILYCYQQSVDGEISSLELVQKITAGDIDPTEIYVGGPLAKDAEFSSIDKLNLFSGVKEAAETFKVELAKQIG